MNHAQVDLLSRYFPLHRGTIKPGSHRIQNLLGPFFHTTFFKKPLILVAGTNGKGSVCALLESSLRSLGFKTGLYTSPHLVHSNERIRIAGRPISSNALESSLVHIETWRDKNLVDATFFEIATAAAFLNFDRERVDVVICEVGLGGRLDSTNVCAPTVSVVTNIGFDHQELLGSTISDIAKEKAYVARRNRPLVIGPLNEEALKAVAAVSEKIGSELSPSKEALSPKWETVFRKTLEIEKPWLTTNVDHVRTAVCALARLEHELAMNFDPEKILFGLLATKWPGRFDVRSFENQTLVFDAGHNADGLAHFCSQLQKSKFSGGKFVTVFGCFSDKDWKQMLPLLERFSHTIVFTKVDNERAQDPTVLQKHFGGNCETRVESDLKTALKVALELGALVKIPIVVTGSIALVGGAMAQLSIEPFENGDVN